MGRSPLYVDVTIKVVNESGDAVFFKCKQSTALGKLIAAYCSRARLHWEGVRWEYDGKAVTEHDTPGALGMSDGAELRVFEVKPAPTAAEAAAAAAAAEMAAAAAPACRRARVGVPAALKEQAESFLTNCVSLHSRLPRMSVAADDARAGLMPAALLAHNIAVSSLLRRLEPAAADAAPMQSQPIESAAPLW